MAVRSFPALLASVAIASMAGSAAAQSTTRVSVDSSGNQANGYSLLRSISPDGRYAALESVAFNLVPGDTNGFEDVFVYDCMARTVDRVDLAWNGDQANNDVFAPSVSADGRMVAFASKASNLVPNDTNGTYDIFVRDRVAGTTTRVSVSSSGTQGNKESLNPVLSADGRYVVFDSAASSLLPGQPHADLIHQIFVHDLQDHTTTLLSVGYLGQRANGQCITPVVSADMRYVAYASRSDILVPNDTNAAWDVYVCDRQTGITERVSVDSAGNQGNFDSMAPAISADGRFVAFHSIAWNLVPGDTNNYSDVFVHDRETGSTERVSVDSSGVEGILGSFYPSISADGQFVAFESVAYNLVPDDTNPFRDIFVRDRQAGTTERVSVDSTGAQANQICQRAAITSDGRIVAFDSVATNLVPGDTNGVIDAFVHDRAICAAGNVNAGLGPVATVLSVNGSSGLVLAPRRTPLTVALTAAPAGPDPANYVLWVWLGLPENQTDLVVSGELLGCTLNPTPFVPGAQPQAYRCLRGGLGPEYCAGVYEMVNREPVSAPFSLVHSRGLAAGVILTIQGVLQDQGSTNPLGLSVTNAVFLKLQ